MAPETRSSATTSSAPGACVPSSACEDAPPPARGGGARLAEAGRRADALGDPVRAKRLLSRALELLPFEGPAYAAALVEFAAAAWNLLPAAELNGLLERGAELAARHGLRALELRAVILRVGRTAAEPPGLGAGLGQNRDLVRRG